MSDIDLRFIKSIPLFRIRPIFGTDENVPTLPGASGSAGGCTRSPRGQRPPIPAIRDGRTGREPIRPTPARRREGAGSTHHPTRGSSVSHPTGVRSKKTDGSSLEA